MSARNFTKNTLLNLIEPVPYPSHLLIQKPYDNFLKVNGYAKLSHKLNLQVFHKLSEIKEIWQEFSPNLSVFDLWDVLLLKYRNGKRGVSGSSFDSVSRGRNRAGESVSFFPD